MEIDSEIVSFLYNIAQGNAKLPTWSRTTPVGVSKAEHFEGFRELFDIADAQIYNATGGRFGANYIVLSADLMGIMHFVKGFTAAPTKAKNGPYYAGNVDGFKVFVSPQLRYNKDTRTAPYFVGFNGETMETSAAVYAPYMPIVPTSLLQGPDGGTSQGFSTLYDLKALNTQLVVCGEVEGSPLSSVYGTSSVPVYTATASV